MRQKKIVNILIVVVASALLLILWSLGLDSIYGKVLSLGANIILWPWPDTWIELITQNSSPVFVVHTLFEGREASYPQEGKLFLMPFIMIITWQILLFFNLEPVKALRSTIENILSFYIIQVIFLLLLTAYYKSEVVQFFFDLLLDSFYIIALFLIVKDTIRYRLIRLTKE